MKRLYAPQQACQLLIAIAILLLLYACATTTQDDSAATAAHESSSPRLEEITVTAADRAAAESAAAAEPLSRKSRIEQRQAKKAEEQIGRERELAQLSRKAQLLEQQRQRDSDYDFEKEQTISRRVDPGMVFQHYGVNPTIDTREENTSTFSSDVDTAAFNLAQAFLDKNLMPDADGIRVEEFVNAFDYGYNAPHEQVFSLQAEAFPSPYRNGYHVLHLGVKATELSDVQSRFANLTFLIDVSGSMGTGNRLETVKQALKLLVDELHPDDNITIVAYTTNARLVLQPTRARQRAVIHRAINRLKPEDSTNIADGIALAYTMANKTYDRRRVNRIILCSDGVANVGTTKPEAMLNQVSKAARKGIYLTTIGVGMGNYNDVILEQLAQSGEGQYAYINSMAEAKKLFVDNLGATLQVVARDTKIQVEFNPRIVERYRLIGYENRAMNNADFTNADKDAAEIGAGHAVTAMYEVKFHRLEPETSFGRFRVSYKPLNSEKVYVIDQDLPETIVRTDSDDASASAQLSYIVAAFAEKLRASYWSRNYDYSNLEHWVKRIKRQVPNRQQAKTLARMIHQARRIDQRDDQYANYVSIKNMQFDHVPVLR